MTKSLLALAVKNAAAPQTITYAATAEGVDIFLKGVISADFGIGADALREAFAFADGKPVNLFINSPGGDVFDAREMQGVIASHPANVTAIIQGVAASAATIVSMAAKKVQMLKGSRYMIHNGKSIAFGGKETMQRTHDLLASFDLELAAEYAARTGQKAEQATAWMDAETWFTADEALKNGFVDEITSNTQNSAMTQIWDLTAYKNAPVLEPLETAPPVENLAALMADQHQTNRNRMRLLAQADQI